MYVAVVVTLQEQMNYCIHVNCNVIFNWASTELYGFFHTIFRYGISSPAKNALLARSLLGSPTGVCLLLLLLLLPGK